MPSPIWTTGLLPWGPLPSTMATLPGPGKPPSVRPLITCAADCSDNATKGSSSLSSTKKGTAWKSIKDRPEKSWGESQASTPTTEFSSIVDTPDASGSDEEGDSDPMVCRPVKPFVILVVVEASKQWNCTALIDSGCSRCLINGTIDGWDIVGG